MNKTTLKVAIVVWVLSIVAALLIGARVIGTPDPQPNDTIVVHRTDTIVVNTIQHDTILMTKVKKVQVAVHDTTTITDSVWVELPYEHHCADIPEQATIWYSGIDPTIDSLRVYQRTITEIVNRDVVRYKVPRITLDVGIGNEEWMSFDPYLFASVDVKIGNYKVQPYAAVTWSHRPFFGARVSRSFIVLK